MWNDDKFRLGELVDVLRQFRFQVVSLVLVDDIGLGQFVQQLNDTWVHSYCFCLFGSCTKFTNSISHGLAIISVVKSSLFFLSDSFQ